MEMALARHRATCLPTVGRAISIFALVKQECVLFIGLFQTGMSRQYRQALRSPRVASRTCVMRPKPHLLSQQLLVRIRSQTDLHFCTLLLRSRLSKQQALCLRTGLVLLSLCPRTCPPFMPFSSAGVLCPRRRGVQHLERRWTALRLVVRECSNPQGGSLCH